VLRRYVSGTSLTIGGAVGESSALVLWDVDHTLVENAGVSKETYAAAFEVLAGQPTSEPVHTGGRTDRLIMRDLFERHGLAVPPWEATHDALTAAGAAHAAAMHDRGTVLPGVDGALKALAEAAGVVQSVLTGNIEANARMKLVALGIDELIDFTVGAYGSDDDDRAALVSIAQQRATAAYGRTFHAGNTVLIGDTPRDVDAGERGGAHVIAVASGVDSADQLRQAGAAVVLDDLTDTARLVSEIRRLTD
jgi:phosphoglycolate phosphatase